MLSAVPRPGAAPYWELARRIGVPARQGKPLREFLDDAGREILAFTGADEVQIWLRRGDMLVRHAIRAADAGQSRFTAPWCPPPADTLEAHCLAALRGDAPASEALDDRSLLLPLGRDFEGVGSAGVLALTLPRRARDRLDPTLLQEVVHDLAVDIGVRRVHASLRERMKELNCLYRMALIVEQPASSLDEVLRGIVEIVPGAWLHPDHAWVRLEIGEVVHGAGGVPQEGPQLSADVVVGGTRRGTLRVGYTGEMPPMDEGPFLAEEQALIRTVAREIALIIERHEAAAEGRRLEARLQHAERLATIGELAAGVGHELNDPLNNILGYAGFIKRREDLPPEVQRDAEVVVTSALHARDTIRQLLTFARRIPQQRTELRLEDVVSEALPLLNALRASAPVQIRTELHPGLPPVRADVGQMRQVVVNLVSNAVHAMPDGGRVTVTTRPAPGQPAVQLVVEDTGTGMTPDVARDAFLPFFTTRANGTGLGLAVVHGVVTAHGGSIELETHPGEGTRFVVTLPAAGAGEIEGDGG